MLSNGFTTIEAKPVSSVTRSFSPGKVAVPPEYQVTDFSRRVAMLVGSACRTTTSQPK